MIDETPFNTASGQSNSQGSPAHSSIDDIVALYMKDVDRTLLRENLRRTVTERLVWAARATSQMMEIYEAGRRHRGEV